MIKIVISVLIGRLRYLRYYIQCFICTHSRLHTFPLVNRASVYKHYCAYVTLHTLYCIQHIAHTHNHIPHISMLHMHIIKFHFIWKSNMKSYNYGSCFTLHVLNN